MIEYKAGELRTGDEYTKDDGEWFYGEDLATRE